MVDLGSITNYRPIDLNSLLKSQGGQYDFLMVSFTRSYNYSGENWALTSGTAIITEPFPVRSGIAYTYISVNPGNSSSTIAGVHADNSYGYFKFEYALTSGKLYGVKL